MQKMWSHGVHRKSTNLSPLWLFGNSNLWKMSRENGSGDGKMKSYNWVGIGIIIISIAVFFFKISKVEEEGLK